MQLNNKITLNHYTPKISNYSNKFNFRANKFITNENSSLKSYNTKNTTDVINKKLIYENLDKNMSKDSLRSQNKSQIN